MEEGGKLGGLAFGLGGFFFFPFFDTGTGGGDGKGDGA